MSRLTYVSPFLKSKGLGKPAKSHMATDSMGGAKADVVCLCETKLKAPSPLILNALGPRRIDKRECKDVVGSSGMIFLIGYDSSLFNLEEVWTRPGGSL